MSTEADTEKKTEKKIRKKVRQKWYQVLFLNLARVFVGFHLSRKYGFRIPNDKRVDLKEPFIIMSNHLTDNDMVFLVMATKRPIFFVCSEHLARAKGGSKLLLKLFNPILMFKGSIGMGTTRKILERIKDGNNICIFPEGSRTFDGRTNPIAHSTGKLVKMAGCSLVTFHMAGGFFVQPRWAKTWRKGPISGGVVNIYSKEQLKSMTPEEVYEAIVKDIAEDAYERQKMKPVKYTGERLAEGLENVFYICPKCGKFETIRTRDDEFFCECGLSGKYDEYGFIKCDDAPFTTIPEWMDWESEKFEKMLDDPGEPMSFSNEGATLIKIGQDHSETVLATGVFYGDRNGFKIGEYSFDYLDMEGTEYINLGNTFLFAINKVYYSVTAEYLGGIKYRKLYIRKKEEQMLATGKNFDIAK